MAALFIPLPALVRHRARYLDDAAFRRLQDTMMADPVGGDVIEWTGGLRKLASATRGAARASGAVCEWSWPFTLYDEDAASDLTSSQRAQLKE